MNLLFFIEITSNGNFNININVNAFHAMENLKRTNSFIDILVLLVEAWWYKALFNNLASIILHINIFYKFDQ